MTNPDFKKRSVEQRKKSLTEYQQIPFSGMGIAGVLPEKYPLYTEELNREYKALRKTPYWQQNPLLLRSKEGAAAYIRLKRRRQNHGVQGAIIELRSSQRYG